MSEPASRLLQVVDDAVGEGGAAGAGLLAVAGELAGDVVGDVQLAAGAPAGGIVGIIAIYIYAFGWSFGHSVACYVVALGLFTIAILFAGLR